MPLLIETLPEKQASTFLVEAKAKGVHVRRKLYDRLYDAQMVGTNTSKVLPVLREVVAQLSKQWYVNSSLRPDLRPIDPAIDARVFYNANVRIEMETVPNLIEGGWLTGKSVVDVTVWPNGVVLCRSCDPAEVVKDLSKLPLAWMDMAEFENPNLAAGRILTFSENPYFEQEVI